MCCLRLFLIQYWLLNIFLVPVLIKFPFCMLYSDIIICFFLLVFYFLIVHPVYRHYFLFIPISRSPGIILRYSNLPSLKIMILVLYRFYILYTWLYSSHHLCFRFICCQILLICFSSFFSNIWNITYFLFFLKTIQRMYNFLIFPFCL